MRRIQWVYLILAFLLLIVGMSQSFRWSISSIKPINPIAYLWNLIPCACLFAAFFISGLEKHRHTFQIVFIPVCFMAFSFWGVVTLATEIFISATTEVTDVGKYEYYLESHPYSKVVNHFPRTVPPNAKHVRFSYLPQFLQGGGHIRLCYSTSSSEISDLYDQFSQMKTKSFFRAERTGRMFGEGWLPTTTSFHVNGSENRSLSTDYEVMIFDELKSASHVQNHGQSHGVTISKKRNEIKYWASWW